MNTPNPAPLAPAYAVWRLPFGTVRLDEDGLCVDLSRSIEDAEVRELQDLMARIDALSESGVMGLPRPPSDDELAHMSREGRIQWTAKEAAKAVIERFEGVAW